MRSTRSGFTLIELLVVIAIIAVLIALLLAGGAGGARGGPPHAVHQQPQADRPGDPQLHLDVSMSSRRWEAWTSTAIRPARGLVPQTASIHLRLTNYLEQRAVYDAYNFMLGDVANGSSVPANTTVMATKIPGYLCPSDANPGSTQNLAVGYTAQVTCVNYAINGGVNRQNYGGTVNGVAWWLGGNASYGSRVSLASVTDGTSNTAAFSEWVKGKSGQNTPGLNLVYAIAQYTNGGPQNDFSMCTPPRPRSGISRANTGRSRTPAGAARIITSCLPTSRPARSAPAFGNVDSFIGPSSFHPGGANVLLLDGSVRFIKSSVGLAAWNALGTRSGGEVISADAY